MPGAKSRMREKKMQNQPRNIVYNGPGGAAKVGRGSQVSGWVRGHQAGGHSYQEDLPKYITASYFAKARAAEIRAMLRAAKPQGSCHVFAALPKHMRRRAMSHSSKRLPKRLREAAERLMERSQIDAQKKQISKTRSRRARRRHGNMLLEFNRRQRKNKWLETHVWHSKRFHMQKRWSFCLPLRPTDKSYRTSYRAMKQNALLQDLSYYCCMELQGSEEHILMSLARLTSKQAGMTFAAVCCLSGARQGSVHLYRADQFPHCALGPVDFLWRPRTPNSSHRQLWIWIHPALKQDVLEELQRVCGCVPAVTVCVEPASGVKESEEQQVLGDGTKSEGSVTRWESADASITINDLTMEIVRFRLIGPLSHLVLTDTLQPANEVKGQHEILVHQQQQKIFQQLKSLCSTAEFHSGSVLGLTVDDPRLSLPLKRHRILPDLQHFTGDSAVRELLLNGVASDCSDSSLWDEAVRESVTHSKIPEKELNRLRSELLVPGSRLSLPSRAAVPVLLVHQAGRVRGDECLHWGSGWDVLLPKGWAMAFWIPLVYRGVRVAGLHMSLKHSQFLAQPHFPDDYPDCPAGARHQSERQTELLDHYKRRPPSKRTNYIKHGCLAPFSSPWQQLVEEWEELMSLGTDTPLSTCKTTPSDFTVLRCVKVLRQLSAWCRPPARASQVRSARSSPLTLATAAALQREHGRGLVWVRLRLLKKGKPAPYAMVCVPTNSDLQPERVKERDGPAQEPLHKDHPKAWHSGEGPRGVWPHPLPSVLAHCSRMTLGWVTQGDFSLCQGCGEALAFISLTGLLHMLLQQEQQQRGIVLLRNPSSLQYRYASISVDV